MGHWNYRSVQSLDQQECFIAAVYYDDAGRISGWLRRDDELRWATRDQLKGTIELVMRAFDRPLLRVNESGELDEADPT